MSQERQIFELLRHKLVNGGYEYGQKLRAEALRQEYGCSASTIRESLFRLSTAGLVEFQDQRGFRVPEASAQLQHELTQLRIMLESEGAVLSIRLGDVDWEARLTAAHHKLSHIESRIRTAGDMHGLLDLWSRAEQEFHETLIDACGSTVLKRTHQTIYHQFRQQLIAADRQFLFIPENLTQHRNILDAAVNRNEDLVRTCIHDHLSRNLIKPLPERVKATA